MDWTSILNLFPVAVRLEPVIVKYWPAAIALYKADEPTALQMFGDVAAAFGNSNPIAYVNLLIKWGPTLATFVQTEGPVVQQFIADVKAAIGTAPVPSIAPAPVVTAPAPILSGPGVILSGPGFVFPPA
jgi:hypothetical protein